MICLYAFVRSSHRTFTRPAPRVKHNQAQLDYVVVTPFARGMETKDNCMEGECHVQGSTFNCVPFTHGLMHTYIHVYAYIYIYTQYII